MSTCYHTGDEVSTMLNYGPAVLIIFSVFVGILLNRRDVTSLKEDMVRQFNEVNRQFSEVNRRLTLIEDDQKQFFTITGKWTVASTR